ncbi:PEP-CTERM sorting domain-containing protein [Photobacterium minamisatsumaniensis]|uniref:PEP-CTERM sorting domain-containing protein n=1 Tax=Photobacterium minamisatsumaniensis TaxID=2910233 RepID=UPI003D0D1461
MAYLLLKKVSDLVVEVMLMPISILYLVMMCLFIPLKAMAVPMPASYESSADAEFSISLSDESGSIGVAESSRTFFDGTSEGDARFRWDYEWEVVSDDPNDAAIKADANTLGEATNGRVESSLILGLTITIILDEISSIIFSEPVFNASASANGGEEPQGSAFSRAAASGAFSGDLGEFFGAQTFSDISAGTYVIEWAGLDVAGAAERRIPEPTSFFLFLAGILGIGSRRRFND